MKAASTPAPGKEQVGHHDQNYYDLDHYQGPHFFFFFFFFLCHLPSYL